jgi:hypothetical protein
MKKNSFLKVFILIIIINAIFTNKDNFFSNDIIYNYLKSNNQEEINDEGRIKILFMLPEIVFAILKSIMASQNKDDIEEYTECINNLRKIYTSPSSNDLTKLYDGSSKGFIELGSFYNCIAKNDSNNDNYNFYTVYPILTHELKMELAKINNDSLFHDFWIFGFCVNKKIKCEDIAFKEMIIKINKKFKVSEIDVFNEYYNNIEHINIINNGEYYEKMTNFKDYNHIFKFLPLIFIVIQILFIIFKIVPVKIFGFCMKRKYIREIKNDPKKIDSLLNKAPFIKKINSKIRECFSLSDNFDDFISNKKNNEIFKEEDLTYIKGMKAIGSFFLVFGTTYIYFFNYPICISEDTEKKDYLKSWGCRILIIFWRFAPALLLSASGYSLSYKFLNFLDKKLLNYAQDNIENNNLKDENNKIEENDNAKNLLEKQEKSNVNISDVKTLSNSNSTKNNAVNYTAFNNSNNDISSKIEDSNTKSYLENTLGIKFYQNDISKKTLNNMFGNQGVNETVTLSKISTSYIPYSVLFNFLFRQIHKIFCLLIGIHFFKDTLPIIVIWNNRGAPLMNYFFVEVIDKLQTGLGNIFFYKNFVDLFQPHSTEKTKDEKVSFLELFSILVCELNYFIIGSISVFICYKKKIALDTIIIFLIILFLIFKIIYNFKKEPNNPGMFYVDSVYQRFFFNPIFNFNYYLIGMLFGIVNYVVQNDISKNDSFIKERPLVGIPIFISKACDYKKKKNIVHYVLSLIFLIIFFVIFSALFSSNFKQIIQDNKPSNLFKFISSIDIDIFIYLFHFFIISCYISGRNMFFKFFNSNVWLQISKLYFWIIIFTSFLTYYILYKTETQVNLGLFIVMIYGAICGTNLYVISLLFFIIFELPYKKLIKLYFNISSKLNEIVDEEDAEEDNNTKQYPLHSISMNEINEKDLETDTPGYKGEDDDEN